MLTAGKYVCDLIGQVRSEALDEGAHGRKVCATSLGRFVSGSRAGGRGCKRVRRGAIVCLRPDRAGALSAGRGGRERAGAGLGEHGMRVVLGSSWVLEAGDRDRSIVRSADWRCGGQSAFPFACGTAAGCVRMTVVHRAREETSLPSCAPHLTAEGRTPSRTICPVLLPTHPPLNHASPLPRSTAPPSAGASPRHSP